MNIDWTQRPVRLEQTVRVLPAVVAFTSADGVDVVGGGAYDYLVTATTSGDAPIAITADTLPPWLVLTDDGRRHGHAHRHRADAVAGL